MVRGSQEHQSGTARGGQAIGSPVSVAAEAMSLHHVGQPMVKLQRLVETAIITLTAYLFDNEVFDLLNLV